MKIYWFNYISPSKKKQVKEVLVAQSCPTLCNPMDCSPPASSCLWNSQARKLEWVVIHFSRWSSQPRDQIQISCIAGGFFAVWATRETI